MGRYFGVEPAQFLRGTHLEWAVNVAAYDVASKAEAEAARKAKGSAPTSRGLRR